MSFCTEIAIFKVSESNRNKAMELSRQVIKEINQDNDNVVDYEVLEKIDDPTEVCWRLTWRDQAAAENLAKHWNRLPSASLLEEVVDKKIYCGYFHSI